MTTHLSTSLPDETLAPGTTITVTLDDASAVIETLNVYGVSPPVSREDDTAPEPFVPLFVYEGT